MYWNVNALGISSLERNIGDITEIRLEIDARFRSCWRANRIWNLAQADSQRCHYEKPGLNFGVPHQKFKGAGKLDIMRSCCTHLSCSYGRIILKNGNTITVHRWQTWIRDEYVVVLACIYKYYVRNNTVSLFKRLYLINVEPSFILYREEHNNPFGLASVVYIQENKAHKV